MFYIKLKKLIIQVLYLKAYVIKVAKKKIKYTKNKTYLKKLILRYF